MKLFLIVEPENYHISEYPGTIHGILYTKSKKTAKEMLWEKINDIIPEHKEYIKNSFIGKEEAFLIDKLCEDCEYADPIIKTCPHKCLKDNNEWYEKVYLPYFKIEKLAKMAYEAIFKINRDPDNIKILTNFVMEKSKEEILKHYSFIDIDSIPLYR